MRNMRSPLPIFIFIGLALIAIIGVIILGASSTSAVVEVNNSYMGVNNTSTDDLALTMYHEEYYLIYGIAAILFLVAAYFALRNFL
jgi:hypothetical protein